MDRSPYNGQKSMKGEKAQEGAPFKPYRGRQAYEEHLADRRSPSVRD